MNTFNIAFVGYPHYYTLKMVDDKMADPNNSFITGTSKITGCYDNKKPIVVNDEIIIAGVKHVVTEINEERQPKSTLHPIEVTYYNVSASYIHALMY